MASIFSRIERALEEAVEGTSLRLFRTRIQPVQLAKAAGRAMLGDRVIGPDGPEVPNAFRVALNPEDFARFSAYRRSLESRIEAYLAREAAAHRVRPVAPWHVEVCQDPAVPPRSIAVRARMEDTPARDPSGREDREFVEPTAVFSPPKGTGKWRLELEDGRAYDLCEDVTAIGRALENDLVIADTRVSRFHAEIHRSGQTFELRDLNSTNGTMVGGRVTRRSRLEDGDAISLGGFMLIFRVAGTATRTTFEDEGDRVHG